MRLERAGILGLCLGLLFLACGGGTSQGHQQAPAAPVITAPNGVTANQTGYTATVPLVAGLTYQWTIAGGAITAGNGSAQVTFTAGAVGILQLDCITTNGAGSSSSAGTVSIPVTATATASSAPGITAFSATPASITAGQGSTLSWTATGATSLSIDQGVGTVTGTSAAVTPTATTTYTLTATNANGTVTAATTVTVSPAPSAPVINSFMASPASITSGQSSTLSWSVSGATSISIDQGVGAVSGTSGTVSPYNTTLYTLTATNATGSVTATTTVIVSASIPVSPGVNPPSGLAYSINPAVYTVGTLISADIPSSSGSAITSYAVAPALPAGLTLNPVTGVLTGTPTAVTSSLTYAVTATNAAGIATVGLNLTVNGAVIAPSGLGYSVNPAVYTVGTAITANTPSSSGSGVTSYAVAPALPAGLTLNTSTGVISGTPTAVATAATYVITATNAAGNATVGLGLTVAAATVAPSGLTYSTNPAVYANGMAITANTPSSTGGDVAAYSVAPALPAGLSLNALTGVISGTPTAITPAATYTVTATNAAGKATLGVAITVNAAVTVPSGLMYSANPVIYTTGTVIPSNTPSSAGGAVVSYAVSPALPAGLVLNASTGVITGTPTGVAAVTTYTVTATNPAGTATVGLSLTVNAAVLAPSNLAYAVNPATYAVGAVITSNTPTSIGGAVTSYAVAPALPAGLSLNTSTGAISGTPSVAAATATYTVTATNSAGNATAGLVLTVNGTAVLTYSYTTTPASLNFGTVLIGATSPEMTFQLTNTGTGALTPALTVYGPYTFSTRAPSTLAPGASCTVGVKFSPTAVGATVGDAVNLVFLEIPTYPYLNLNGTGQSPTGLTYSYTTSPSSLNFGTVLMGSTSPEMTFQLTNTGTGALTPQFYVYGAFTFSTHPPSSLAPGASCTVGLKFSPTAWGATVGTGFYLTFVEIPSFPYFNLYGTGQSPTGLTYSYTTSPSSLSFGTVNVGTTSPEMTFTLTNTGTGPLTPALTIDGPYTFSTRPPSSLAAGASCQVGVKFTPTLVGATVGDAIVLAFIELPTYPYFNLNGTGQ